MEKYVPVKSAHSNSKMERLKHGLAMALTPTDLLRVGFVVERQTLSAWIDLLLFKLLLLDLNSLPSKLLYKSLAI